MQDFLEDERPDIEADDEANAISFNHWGVPVKFYAPSDGQEVIMLSMGGRGMSKEAAATFIQLFIELGDDDTQRHFRDLLLTRGTGFGFATKGGILDIWEGLIKQWSGKASPQPSVSDKPRRKTGSASTASTRVGASTSSRSRSRVSST